MIIRTCLAASLLLLGGTLASQAKDCRMPDAPPGVRVPAPLGCAAKPDQVKPDQVKPDQVKPDQVKLDQGQKAKEPSALRASSQTGFIDLGGAGQIRIGGRVRADFVTRR